MESQGYDTIHVTNMFLKKGFEDGVSIDPMKLQKLLYYFHGWFLAVSGQPGISHPIEAWTYGPVIPAVYHRFKHFGANSISTYAEEFDKESGTFVAYGIPESDTNFMEVFDVVWRKYKDYDALQLSAMTHAKGTPWSHTKRNFTIPNEVIRQYFVNLAMKQHDYRE